MMRFLLTSYLHMTYHHLFALERMNLHWYRAKNLPVSYLLNKSSSIERIESHHLAL